MTSQRWRIHRYGPHEVLEAAPTGHGRQRLNHLFEARCDYLARSRQEHRVAIETEVGSLTFRELDALANRAARYLTRIGVRPGDRVGLLVDRSLLAYASMLAVLKAGAAFVPLDPSFPADRIAFMMDDAGVDLLVTVEAHGKLTGTVPVEKVVLEQILPELDAESGERPPMAGAGDLDDLCYIVYTSGSTGRPKGVPITHANVCNFVRVAAETYGLHPGDRMYQGLTLAFDFSVEEIWVPLVSGATLVPAPSGPPLVGPDLAHFLREQRVTALCCVPTLLGTIGDVVLPDLTFLLVSGEACPDELAQRWHAPGRRFLNVYGPTEATVTATWTELRADGAVTIGGPLPTYSVVVLAVDEATSLPRGAVGEIAIAGPGVASGYLNREDKTRAAFVDDFIGIEGNPSGRLYRTGDLGKINERNEIEYLGRIDAQVKVRGYRVELAEVESVLMELPGVAQAVVTAYEPRPGSTELAAFYVADGAADGPGDDRLIAELRERLPAFMVPTSLEAIHELPMSVANKVDRNRLPEPTGRRPDGAARVVDRPATQAEQIVSGVVSDVLGLDGVSTRAHFFDDLGADSLSLARICTELRAHPGMGDLSVKDLYLNPTVAQLAGGRGGAEPERDEPPLIRTPPHRPTRRQHMVCGLLQAAWLSWWLLVASAVVALGGRWLVDAPDVTEAVRRSLVFLGGGFVAASLLSIVLKWLLIGRWRVERIPVWSFRYFRYWAVRSVIGASPLRLFHGSPLYNVYLRLLGARIGRGVTILSTSVPVCTDLVSIGDHAVVRADVTFSGCKAEDGFIVTGPVELAPASYVGEATVLDVDTWVGAFATVGHRSAVPSGRMIPTDETWHGSPAEPTPTEYRFVERAGGSGTTGWCDPPRWRRYTYSVWRLVATTAALGASGVAAWALIGAIERYLAWFAEDVTAAGGWGSEVLGAVLLSIALPPALLVVALASLIVVPRLLDPWLRTHRVYPLYGWRYAVSRGLSRFGNSTFLNTLFGDSALIVGFLQLLGYDLERPVQTGVNFGLAQRHGTPLRTTVGRGTMVSDGLTIMNFDYSSSSFMVSPVRIGTASFVGNDVHVPAQSVASDDCLLATKVQVPVDGPVRSGVGLLGSPAFEIPRSVARDEAVHRYDHPSERRERLRMKLVANLVAIVGFLVHAWLVTSLALTAVVLIANWRAAMSVAELSAAVFATSLVLLALVVFLGAAVERAAVDFRSLRPMTCSIYDRYYWQHERLWKWSRSIPIGLFNGTPFKPLIWRLLGVRIGRRVLDEGCLIPERSLTTIGDDVCLNERTTIQGHSLEDGIFKSDRIAIADGATLGVGAFVHYGTEVGAWSLLGADSFLMKGESVPAGATWAGNPARSRRWRAQSQPPSPSTERNGTSSARRPAADEGAQQTGPRVAALAGSPVGRSAS